MNTNKWKTITILVIVAIANIKITAQHRWFTMPSFWEVGGEGMAFNIEAFDMNKDSNLDVVVGNWNDTYVYYGGYGILDTQVDLHIQAGCLQCVIITETVMKTL